jgi:uncharacterized BrkB/YihY/UPF0761 family membrane protein
MVTKEEMIEKQKTTIRRLKEQLKDFKRETKARMSTLITSAFGFVAALFWRDAIKALLDQTFGVNPGQGFWLIQMGIAVVVTIMAVIVIFLVSKTMGNSD